MKRIPRHLAGVLCDLVNVCQFDCVPNTLPNYRLRDLNLLLSTIDRDHDNVRVRCLCHTGFAVFPNSKRPVTTEPQSENPDSLCRLDDVIEIPRLDRYTVHKNCHSSDIGMIGVCLVLSHSVVKGHRFCSVQGERTCFIGLNCIGKPHRLSIVYRNKFLS